jgi:hypothetical protein
LQLIAITWFEQRLAGEPGTLLLDVCFGIVSLSESYLTKK